MKLFILSVLVASALSSPLLVTEESTAYFKEHSSFEVYDHDENPHKGWTVEEVRRFRLGIELNTEQDREYFADRTFTIEKYLGAIEADLPDSFDARDKWGSCIHPIRDQQQCGSCWAFSASEVLSDRFCIGSNKAVDVVLSPEYQLSCDWWDHGCNGGIISWAWDFLEKTGEVTDSCDPYTSGTGKVPWTCPKSCADATEAITNYKAKKGSTKNFASVATIKAEIMTNGPVQGGFTVYEDFMHYKSGVYTHKSGSMLGGHAIKIIGWGNEDGKDYWLVANSWNTTWGIEGFFKIAFGECGIEGQVYAGLADIESVIE